MLVLTHQERRVILFLFSAAFLGIAINLLVKKHSHLEAVAWIQQDAGKININKADAQELKSLPGIGEKLASSIVDYRQKEGYFEDTEELKKIKGIYQSRFDKIKDHITVK
jgi:comEA protein